MNPTALLHSLVPLLQAAPAGGTRETPTGRLIWVSVVLVLIVVAGLVLVSQLKRRLQHSDSPISAGFTLSDLRQMHKSGQMSDEEFERAKAKVVEAARRAAEREELAKADRAAAALDRRQQKPPTQDPPAGA